jgi:ribosomal protein S18 acetylase RimI-like enzyme
LPDLPAIVRAPALAPSPFQRYRSTPGKHAVHDGLVLTSTGVPGPDTNYAFVYGPIAPAHVFELASEFFGNREYAITIEVESAPAMPAALEARGWVLDEEEPALALAPIPPQLPAPPDELKVEVVTNASGFETFRAVARIGARWIPSLAAATDPAVALLVGYVDGAPVATARLGVFGAVADITSVTTVPELRRRGLGTAMTWAAI